MKATIVHLPPGVGLGDPPQRVAETLFVPSRDPTLSPAVFTRGEGDRTIVFDDLEAFLFVLRYLHGGSPVPRYIFESWRRQGCDVDHAPCSGCRNLHPEGEDCPSTSRSR